MGEGWSVAMLYMVGWEGHYGKVAFEMLESKYLDMRVIPVVLGSLS